MSQIHLSHFSTSFHILVISQLVHFSCISHILLTDFSLIANLTSATYIGYIEGFTKIPHRSLNQAAPRHGQG